MKISEDQTKYLLAIIDSLVIVDESSIVDKFKCTNCRKVAIKHNVANCKHVFCSSCIRDLFDEPCPGCENVITEVTKDAQFENGLLQLKIECQYKEHGCQEIISVHECQENETKCKFSTKVLLPKLYRGRVGLPPEELKKVKTAIMEINEKTKTISKSFEKIAMKINTTEEMVSNLILGKTSDQEEDTIKGQTTIDSDDLTGEVTIFKWKITGAKQKLALLKGNQPNTQVYTINSEKFYNQHLDLDLVATLSQQMQNIAISLDWSKCNEIYWNARKFTLIDQSNQAEKKHISVMDLPYFSKIEDRFTMTWFLKTILAPIWIIERDDTYILDDSILIKFSILPHSLMYKSMVFNNGILLWRIRNYKSKKQDEVTGRKQCLISEDFYTDPMGLKLHAILYLDGNSVAKGKHISIYVSFNVGELDHVAQFPHKCRVSFLLLDQSDSLNKQHVFHQAQWAYNKTCVSIGKHDFVLQSKAEEAIHVKDDTLIFKILIEKQ